MFKEPKLENNNKKNEGITRRSILGGVGVAILGENLIKSAEIKGGENWIDGYDKLQHEMMMYPNEVISIYVLRKDGTGKWQKFVLGKSASSQHTEDSLEFMREIVDRGEPILIDWHTHPLNNGVVSRKISQEDAKEIRDRDDSGLRYSSPPSANGLIRGSGDFVYNAIRSNQFYNAKTKYVSAVMEAYGVWFLETDLDNHFIKALLGLLDKHGEIKEKIESDPAYRNTRMGKLERVDPRLWTSSFDLFDYLWKSRFEKEICQEVKTFNLKINAFLKKYQKNANDLNEKLKNFSGVKTGVNDDRNLLKEIKEIGQDLGFKINFLPHEQARKLDAKELSEVLN